MTIRIGINGYGTIGKRIADAVRKVKDFELVGVAKYSANYSAIIASKSGIDIYVPEDKLKEFRDMGLEPAGTIEDLIDSSDLVYDASPPKQGLRNKELYIKYRKPAIFQGGEPPEVAELSYSTLCNYEQAIGKKYVRVVSCNTTGILRLICSFGLENVDSIFGVIVRRASDPGEDLRGPVNSIVIDSPTVFSHHGRDVATVTGGKPVVNTVALIAPSTLMHMQVLNIKIKQDITKQDFIKSIEMNKRILFIDSSYLKIDSTGKVIELSRDTGRLRNDIYENIIFSNMIEVNGDTVIVVQAIHQEAIVIPENIDVAYAVMNLEVDPFRVLRRVNEVLEIGKIQATIITRKSIR